MGTTFVGLGEPRRGFWMTDSMLELWLRLLALHVEDPVEPGLMAAKIRDQWLLASRGFFTGCVPDGLAEAVATPEGEALVRDAIQSLLVALRAVAGQLDKNVLNILGFAGGEFTADIPKWRLIEVGQAYLALLDGQITASPGDTSFMPGCGDQPHPNIGP